MRKGPQSRNARVMFPLLDQPQAVVDLAALGRLMGELATRYPHVELWGGCCGTWDKHLKQIVRQVKLGRCSEATTAR